MSAIGQWVNWELIAVELFSDGAVNGKSSPWSGNRVKLTQFYFKIMVSIASSAAEVHKDLQCSVVIIIIQSVFSKIVAIDKP